MKYKFLFILGCFTAIVCAQTQTNSNSVKKGLNQKQLMQEQSLVKNIQFKNIGPTIMSGRVTDLAVNPNNPTEFYVGYASGGVWHTVNNGQSFTPILDSSQTQNVGAIDVHWESKTIWVGTGECNASRSSYAGIGMLKSTNNGASWDYSGLMDSHHIGRVLVNQNNKNEIVVAVTGHLYSPNKERGIFKTNDGGKTWKKTLFIDDETGIIDVQHAPNNFNVMYAASWTKDRKAWNFTGNGTGSAIYKSIDAGNTWTLVTNANSGFPTGEGVGRIGLAVYNEDVVYAFHDNQFRRSKDNSNKSSSKALTKDDFKTMSVDAFLKLNSKELNTFLKQNGFQEKYRAENVKQMVKNGHVKPIDLAKYLENANSLLFDTPVVGAELFKTTNGGKTWQKTHTDYLDDLVYSYGYYFGVVNVHPSNQNQVYIAGVPILKSVDGGKTFKSVNGDNVHVDHHIIWTNPNNPEHVILGNDGGVNISYDGGAHWTKCNSPAVGQFYTVNVDNQKPYNVYGGFQDNGVWVGPNTYKHSVKWHEEGKYPYSRIMGGDGMQVQIDNRNSNIVYTGFQFGNYYRLNRTTKEQTYIQPKHQLGEAPYRFNWQTPILLSVHNQDILYLGGNKLIRSMDQGNTWQAISKDLTQGGKKGNVAYGTLTSISESPFEFGLIYAGSDDGLVHIAKNSGATWELISNSFPKNLWVSRVIASTHKKERVYVALNGYRWDDFNVYLYASDDYGKTWENISSNIPTSAVNVIKEDPTNENVLYVGTDNGAYVSFNKGNSWEAFVNGLPAVAVHDLVIQEQAKDLILGTHGRSLYKANIGALQQFNEGVANTAITIFPVNNIKYSGYWGSSWSKWLDAYEPNLELQVYAKTKNNKTLSIISENGIELNTVKLQLDKGFNTINYNLTLTEKATEKLTKRDASVSIKKAKNGHYYLPKGKYELKIDNESQYFEVE